MDWMRINFQKDFRTSMVNWIRPIRFERGTVGLCVSFPRILLCPLATSWIGNPQANLRKHGMLSTRREILHSHKNNMVG